MAHDCCASGSGKNNKKNKGKSNAGLYFGIFFLIAIIAIGFIFANPRVGSSLDKPMLKAAFDSATLYKDTSCGCCGQYVSYVNGITGASINVKTMPDVAVEKDKLNIPKNLRSCHTTLIGGYYVEGHVPLEAVQKLLLKKPNIAGIALPDMPAGSPGMPGSKSGKWTIYAIGKDGSVTEFMTI